MNVKFNAVVNILSLLFFIISAFSGFVLMFLFPPGGGGLTFLGFVRHKWINIHTQSSVIFILLVVVHLMLHWNYFKNLPIF